MGAHTSPSTDSAKAFIAAYWLAFTAILALAAFVWGAFENYGTVNPLVAAWLTTSLAPDVTKNLSANLPGVRMLTGVVFGVTGLLLVTATLIAGMVIRERQYRSGGGALRAALENKFRRLQKAHLSVSSNARRFVQKSYPVQATPPCAFESVDIEIVIDKDGDVHYARTDRIRAIPGEALHYYTLPFLGDPTSTPIEFIDDLSLSVKDVSGQHEVCFLAFQDEPLTKRVAIFPLPRLDGSYPRREIKTQMRWPGLSRGLISSHEETWTLNIKSREAVKKIVMKIFYDKSFGQVRGEIASAKDPKWTLTPEKSRPDKQGFVFEATDCPGDIPEHQLRFWLS